MIARSLLSLSLGMSAVLAQPAVAQTGAWPNHPIRLVVGFPAGGASDVAARVIAAKLSTRLNQTIVVDNRPGAASNIGTETVVRSPADGYTLLFGTISLAINPSLYKSTITYDPIKDLAPIAMVASTPFILVVNPQSPFKSVHELVDGAKNRSTDPRELYFATAGNGSGSHLFTELFKSMAGINLTHVPYKGAAPAMNDVLGNQIPITFDNIVTVRPLVESGKLRALAVSSKVRSKVMPDVPTLDEAGVKGFDATTWFGLFAPAGTPRPVIDRVGNEVNEVLKDPEVRDKLLNLGAEPVIGTPETAARFYSGEVARWAKVVTDAKVQID
ncbi:tripartite tricarboxylate transporter substrate binding protein [soil metagenome]